MRAGARDRAETRLETDDTIECRRLITEPSVCVPNASGTIPAATAAADPDDDPPGVCLRFQGLTVGPG